MHSGGKSELVVLDGNINGVRCSLFWNNTGCHGLEQRSVRTWLFRMTMPHLTGQE